MSVTDLYKKYFDPYDGEPRSIAVLVDVQDLKALIELALLGEQMQGDLGKLEGLAAKVDKAVASLAAVDKAIKDETFAPTLVRRVIERVLGNAGPPAAGPPAADLPAAGPLAAGPLLVLRFVVNGEEWVVDVESAALVEAARDYALKISGNTGRSSTDWEIREETTGALVNANPRCDAFASGTRLFLTVKVGAGGAL
jgi:hypothetical protein